MSHSNEDAVERKPLDAALIRGYDGGDVCVLYPLDATDEELKTTWIRCTVTDLHQLADSR